MKKLLKISFLSILILSLSLLTSACVKKNPGPGGTSAIRGKIMGQEFKPGEVEIQQLIFTGGNQIEHGDYFLLNKVSNNDNYYIYFKNPNWVSVADPGLDGRIGLEVIFNYSDSNLDIAQAVKNKLTTVNPLNFTMSLNQDLLTMVYKQVGDIPDLDNGNTNFATDVVNQGSANFLSTALVPMAEKRVYICYGDDTHPSDDVRTNSNGEFIFENLQVGNYKVYVIGDQANSSNIPEEVSQNVLIEVKESIKDIGTLQIIF
ncbi:MAG: carboxypeptidase regulatory-like domain-containing protein [Sphingomonadales bacterium]|nr:carboxypeptidase regulatory-like domain-containing protein [Sphingomonadales bacterium]